MQMLQLKPSISRLSPRDAFGVTSRRKSDRLILTLAESTSSGTENKPLPHQTVDCDASR